MPAQTHFERTAMRVIMGHHAVPSRTAGLFAVLEVFACVLLWPALREPAISAISVIPVRSVASARLNRDFTVPNGKHRRG